MSNKILNEIDTAKPDGFAVGFIISAILFILTRILIKNYWLWVLSFLIVWFLSMSLLIFPYAKKIETRLFRTKNVILRRLIIVFVKGLAFLVAVWIGLANLAYWA